MRIITRDEWGASLTKVPSASMMLPAREVWVHHSVSLVTNDPLGDVRAVERVGISRFGYGSYSYLIHPLVVDAVFELRGTQRGAHTAGRNSTSFGVCFVGDYRDLHVTDIQVELVRQLIDILIDRRHLRPGVYPTGGHRDAPASATVCPGPNAYRRIPDMRLPWEAPADLPQGGAAIVSNAPFAALLVHPNGGYLEIGADGGVFAFGDPPAPFFGSLGAVKLNQPIVAAEWTPTYQGYYLLGRDGGVFAFGDAQHRGNALWAGG